MWGHHQPDVSDHPEHDGDAPDGVVAVPLLLLGHQDEPEVGQDVGAQHLSVVYLSLLVFLRSECRNTQLCGWCQLVWRNSGNCDLMVAPDKESGGRDKEWDQLLLSLRRFYSNFPSLVPAIG